MGMGNWIGQALIGQELVGLLHSLIIHTLLQLGIVTRPEIHVHCNYQAFRPVSNGTTQFVKAMKLTCTIYQKVTG